MFVDSLSENELLKLVRTNDEGLYKVSSFDNSIVMEALVNAKLTRSELKRMGTRTAVMNHPFVKKRAAQPFKRYDGAPLLDLDEYKDFGLSKSLKTLTETRKSTKSYSPQPVSLAHLGALLCRSYGIMRTELLHEEQIPWKFRPIPSPGGLFASEIYIVALNSSIPKGLYHYRPDLNSLEQLSLQDHSDFVVRSCGIEPYIDSIEKVGAVIITTSLIERLYIKYGERSYKFMMIETGALTHQLSIVAEALDLGSCALGGYIDDEVHEVLGVDGVLESVQCVMVVGNKNV